MSRNNNNSNISRNNISNSNNNMSRNNHKRNMSRNNNISRSSSPLLPGGLVIVERKPNFGSNNRRNNNISSLLSTIYNERIEKTTSFDYEDLSLLRKEIEAVKDSLSWLQKDHKKMLDEKKQLEDQYFEVKDEVKKTLETNEDELKELLNAELPSPIIIPDITSNTSLTTPIIPDTITQIAQITSDFITELPEEYESIMKNCVYQAKELTLIQTQLEKSKEDFKILLSARDEIERALELQERKYLERIRESHQRQQSSISSLLNAGLYSGCKRQQPKQELSKLLINTNVATSNASSSTSWSKIKTSSDDESVVSTSELIPAHCLSPPHARNKSCTNPISLLTDEEIIRHQRRYSLADRWVEDDEVSTCQQAGCSVRFNFWKRRHHCRRCGNIFCHEHSSESMLLFSDTNDDMSGVWSRVCEGCFKDN
ncbi:6798_t:CDS:2 [Diversispora eburnea]|uniref:6798_t:CDS:1 n=1 Tax=Diversispora eburnea TaxID=1213867 RepID=A0A9N9EXE3_9GLOM|nr:6798_t:CDS:2 [Diversispora eburnea]